MSSCEGGRGPGLCHAHPQPSLVTWASSGSHLSTLWNPHWCPLPGQRQSRRGHQNGTWRHCLAYAGSGIHPLDAQGKVRESICAVAKSGIISGHIRNRSLAKCYLYVSTHTHNWQLRAHTRQCIDSACQKLFSSPGIHKLISPQKTYLQMFVKCVYRWEINLSLEGTSHLHKRAQNSGEKSYWE